MATIRPRYRAVSGVLSGAHRRRWLVLAAVVVVAVAGTATGLALTLGGSPVTPVYPTSAAFSADSKYLVLAGQDQAQVVDAASGKLLAQWQPGAAAGDLVSSIGMSRDDTTVTTATYDDVQRWRLASVLAAGVGGHPRQLSAFGVRQPAQPPDGNDQLSPDGTLLVVNDLAGHRIIWDTVTRRVRARVPAAQDDGMAGSVSPDDRVLAVPAGNSWDLWNIAGARPVMVPLAGGASSVALFPPQFLPDDAVVTTLASGGTTLLTDGITGKRLATLPRITLQVTHPVAYSPVTGLTAEGSVPTDPVTVRSAATGRVVARPAPPPGVSSGYSGGFIGNLVFSPDGKTLAVVAAVAPGWVWQVRATAR